MGFERHHLAWIVASLVTVASFVGATAYTQNRLARVDALSSTLETNAIPSIEYLSRAAVRLTRLNQLMDDVAVLGPRHDQALAATRQDVAALNLDVIRYLQLPPLAGEQEFWAELRTTVNRAIDLVHASVDIGRRSTDPTPAPADVDDALDRAVGSVLAAVDFDVRQSEAMARDVGRLRASTLRSVVRLDALSTLIALVTVVFAFRATQRHDQLKDELNAALTARVTELDRFAGRVAHDIRSPLSAVTAALALLGRSSDERGRDYITRAQRALRHVQQLVDDLLTFARSGAQADANATADLDAVLEGIVSDFDDPAAEQGIEVIVEPTAPICLRCAPGVIASIVQNLVGNAIKYMGGGPSRTIRIRASVVGDVAHIEVEDTGRGIPPEIESTLFEPFVRGPNEQVSGTGLGLATVKRLVESHAGRVGVHSTAGSGSCFWVDLPASAAPCHEANRRAGRDSTLRPQA
jgi:signal transduction histidine kinase